MFALEAEFLIKMGYPDEAVYLCLDGISSFPKYVAGYTMLAKAYVVLGRLDEAIQTLDDAVKKFPRHKTLINFAKNELGLEYEEFNLANFREIIEREGDFIFDYSTKAYRERLELNKLSTNISINSDFDSNNLDYSSDNTLDNKLENSNDFVLDYLESNLDNDLEFSNKLNKSKSKKTNQNLRKSQEYAEKINLNNLINSDYYNDYQNYNSLYDDSNSTNIDVIDGLANFVQNENILDKYCNYTLNFDTLDLKELEYTSLFNKSTLTFESKEISKHIDIRNLIETDKIIELDLENNFDITENIEHQEEIIEGLEDLDEYFESHKISESEEFNLSELSKETLEELDQIDIIPLKSENLEDLVNNNIKNIQTETVENVDLDKLLEYNSEYSNLFENENELIVNLNKENYNNLEYLNKELGVDDFDTKFTNDINFENNSINSLDILDNLLNDVVLTTESQNTVITENSEEVVHFDYKEIANDVILVKLKDEFSDKPLISIKLDELENVITSSEFDNTDFELTFDNLPKVDLDNLENILLENNLQIDLQNGLNIELESDLEVENEIEISKYNEVIETNLTTVPTNPEPIDILQEVNTRLANAEYSWDEIERLLYENESKIKNETEKKELVDITNSEDLNLDYKLENNIEGNLESKIENEKNSHNFEINSMPISETLAKIYESQEAYIDSINIYRKLIQKNPQKQQEYNKHIKRLKKLIKKLEKK